MPNELKIVIDADVSRAVAGVNKFKQSVDGLTTGPIAQLQKAALLLRTQLSNLSPAALKSDFGKQLTSALATVNSELRTLQKESGVTATATSGIFNKAFQGAKQLANIIPGLGIAWLFGIAITAVDKLTDGFFDAAFGASRLSKAIDDSVNSVTKESSSVIAMVGALQSGTLTSEQFKKVKAELIAQAPEFQKSFDGDKISIQASDEALNKYISKLVTTTRVTAALAIVNETIAKSIAAIAKQGELSTGQKLLTFQFGGVGQAALEAAKKASNLKTALDQLTPDNLNKLIKDTFKELGISFKDFADIVDDKELQKKLDKIKADFEKFQAETIAKARQFTKEFGLSFIVPDLEDSFFKTKNQIFQASKKLLDDVKAGNLKIKLPVITEFEFLPEDSQLTQEQFDKLFKGLKPIQVDAPIDLSIPTGENKKALDDLVSGFVILGDVGVRQLQRLSEQFPDMSERIKEGTKVLSGMLSVATTLNQAVGQGLVNAFNSLFDAILEGRNALKALGNAFKALIIDTVKAIAQMLILRAVASIFLPGAPLPVPSIPGISRTRVSEANFGGFGSGIGSQAFRNVITVNVTGQVSGDAINIVNQRAINSQSRFG